MKFNLIKISKNLLLGVLPVFLLCLSATPIQASSSTRIIFAAPNLQASGLIAEYGLQNVEPISDNPEFSNIYRAQIDNSNFGSFKNNPKIKYAELDQTVATGQISVTQITTVNDPYFTHDPGAEDKQWYLPKVRVPEAWNYSRGSSSVVVAVIDTGIHANHLDLNDGRIIAGYNVVTKKDIPAGADSDDNGHGTAVAGVIGAIPNNEIGVSGINWNVSIMPVKVLSADGKGEISAIAAGIIWAADHGAQIINLSLGGAGFDNSPTISNAIAYAFNKNILIVAAGGNDQANVGLNLDTDPVYPVCADNGRNMILGVAASDVTDRKAAFSNFGINCIDITAPGKRILTTAYLPSEPSNNILIYGSGTSLATPVVSGIAALMKSQNPSLTNIQIRDIILDTATNIDSLNTDDCLGSSCNGFLGKGRIDALLAIQPAPIPNDSLVREAATGNVYLITGNRKHLVSSFVISQRFNGRIIRPEEGGQLQNYETGAPVAPLDGTLIKAQTDPTVFYIDNGVRRPLTYLTFVSRNFSFANVKVMFDSDVAAIPLADWYWPPDGTLVLIQGDPTVYVMDREVARPVTYFVFTQRKLSFAKVITVTPDEFSHVPRPVDRYWLAPLAGTLVKSNSDATVYVIEAESKHPLTAAAFARRNYQFGNIKVLPQAEIDVIAPGAPIF